MQLATSCDVCSMIIHACLVTSVTCRDKHGSGLDRIGSGLKAILAGSGLDRTAIYLIGGAGLEDWIGLRKFVVLM